MNIDPEILNKILEKVISPFYYTFDRPYLKRVILVNSEREIYIIIICIKGQTGLLANMACWLYLCLKKQHPLPKKKPPLLKRAMPVTLLLSTAAFVGQWQSTVVATEALWP